MSEYIDRDAVKRAIEEYCFSPKEITYAGIVKAVLNVPTVDVEDKQTETMIREIIVAIETGTAEANDKVINSTTNLDFRDLLVHTGEMYAGCIGMAICQVIKKYTGSEDKE